MHKPNIELPQVGYSLGLVGRIDLSKPEGEQVQLLPPPRVPIAGQVLLAIAFPFKVMQPFIVRVVGEGGLYMACIPLSSRWFSDESLEHKRELRDILCRAKGMSTEAAVNPPEGEQNASGSS